MSEPAEFFSAGHAAQLAGLTLAMVNYLCRNDVVVPSGGAERGHGRTRRYTFGDVVALRLVAKLSATGVSPLRLRHGLLGLRKHHPEIILTSLPGSHIVTNGSELYLRHSDAPIERAFDGQFAFAFVVELTTLQREVASLMSQAA